MSYQQAKSATRHQRFRAALVLAGLDMRGFAELHGVKRHHLYLVLVGKRPSMKLNAAIDAFIDEQLSNVAA